MSGASSVEGRVKHATAALMASAALVAAAVLIRGRRVLIPTHQAEENPTGVRAEDGTQLHTETHEPGDASVTVVFAHGFASDAQEFRFQCQALERHARVVLFEQRGHGRSEWGSSRSATMDQLGRDLGEVIDQQVSAGPILLVGHSMGGMAVLSLAGQRPGLFEHRVIGVGLLSTAAGHLTRMEMPDPLARVASRTGLAGVAAWSLWLPAPRIDRIAPFRRSWGRRWLLVKLFGEDRPSPEVLSTVQKTWARTQQSVVSAFYPAMVAYNRSDSLGVLLGVPALVLAGDQDQVIPWRRGEHLARALGHDTRLVVVPGAGHMVNLTHPEIVNTALIDLLDRVHPKSFQNDAQ